MSPATAKVKQITEHIEEVFALLAESATDSNEQAVKLALQAMTTIVRRMNRTVLDLAQNNQLGFDLSVRLSERTNEYFTKLLGQWLISDNVASYFVFDLQGFEFLLDTIGVGAETKLEQQKTVEKDEPAFSSLGDSDLTAFLTSSLQPSSSAEQ